MKKSLPAMSCLTGLLGVLLLVAPQDSLAGTVTLDPTVTGNVELLSTGGYSVITNPATLITHQELSAGIDKRSILKFSLDTVPSCAAITTATLKLFNNNFAGAEVPVFGFDGDGDPNNVNVDDAAVTKYSLGVSSALIPFENIEIDLDIVVLTGLASNLTHLGLVLIGDAEGKEGTFKNDTPFEDEKPPVLILSFVSTVLGDFDLDCDVDGHDFLKWQRGETDGGGSQDELAIWEANYGTTATLTTLAAITSVPGPTTLCFVLLGALGLLARGGWRLEALGGSVLKPNASRLQPSAESVALR